MLHFFLFEGLSKEGPAFVSLTNFYFLLIFIVVMGNDIRDSTGTNEEHSSLKLSVYSTFISKLDKTTLQPNQNQSNPLFSLHWINESCKLTNNKINDHTKPGPQQFVTSSSSKIRDNVQGCDGYLNRRTDLYKSTIKSTWKSMFISCDMNN